MKWLLERGGIFVRLYHVPKLTFLSINQAVLWGPEQIKGMDMLYQQFRSSVSKRWLQGILETLVIPLDLATYRTMPLRAGKEKSWWQAVIRPVVDLVGDQYYPLRRISESLTRNPQGS